MKSFSFFVLFLVLAGWCRAQQTTALVDAGTGEMKRPTAALLRSANDLAQASTTPTTATVNGYFADPSTNGSFSASAWRSDLGLVIGTNVQAWDADLDAWALVNPSSYSTTAQIASTYEPIIAAGTTAQYWRGDKSWQTLNQAAVAGLTTADSPTFAALTLSGTDIIMLSPGVASGYDRLDFIAQRTDKGASFQLIPSGTSTTSKIALANNASQVDFGSVFFGVEGATAYLSSQSVGIPATPVTTLNLGGGSGATAWTLVTTSAPVTMGSTLGVTGVLSAGSVQNTVIGSVTPANGTFTNLQAKVTRVQVSGLALYLGADNAGTFDTVTDSVEKIGRMVTPHYTNAEEPLALISGLTQSGVSNVQIGGGTSLANAATGIFFYTAANSTTTTGTTAVTIDTAQQLRALATTESSSTITGAVRIDGGLGVAKKIFAAELNLSNTASTSRQLYILGGASGSPLVTLERTTGATARWDWTLAGGGLNFQDSIAAAGPTLGVYGDASQNEIYAGQRGKTTSDTRPSMIAATSFTSAAGTDVAGQNLKFRAGLGTGAGAPGGFTWETGTALASGTTAQSVTTRMALIATGQLGLGVSASTSALLNLAAGTTAQAPLRIAHGSAPTSPVDGDIWTTTAGVFARINGATVGPL